MTKEEAIRILDPATTREALAEIEYYAGFNGHVAVMKAVEDACMMGVEALQRQESIVKWLEKEKSLYVLAEDGYHKGVWAGLKYAIDVMTKYQFDDDGTVRVGDAE